MSQPSGTRRKVIGKLEIKPHGKIQSLSGFCDKIYVALFYKANQPYKVTNCFDTIGGCSKTPYLSKAS